MQNTTIKQRSLDADIKTDATSIARPVDEVQGEHKYQKNPLGRRLGVVSIA